jgi:hypothetical protein
MNIYMCFSFRMERISLNIFGCEKGCPNETHAESPNIFFRKCYDFSVLRCYAVSFHNSRPIEVIFIGCYVAGPCSQPLLFKLFMREH